MKNTEYAEIPSLDDLAVSPGDWTAIRNSEFWTINDTDHDQIGDTCSSKFIYVDGEKQSEEFGERTAEANAHMMAASKLMYAALKHALHVHGDGYSWSADALAALAAARGEIA